MCNPTNHPPYFFFFWHQIYKIPFDNCYVYYLYYFFPFILNKYKYIKFFISLNYFLLPMCGILGHKEAHLLLNVIIKFFTPFFSLSMPAPLPVKMTYLILMAFFTCQIQTQLKIADGFSKIRSKIIIQKWILGQLRANFPWKFGKPIYPCKKNP